MKEQIIRKAEKFPFRTTQKVMKNKIALKRAQRMMYVKRLIRKIL